MKPAVRARQRPEDAKLLVVHASGSLIHAARADLAAHLEPGDLVVANDAATIPASLCGVHLRSGRFLEVRLAGRRALSTDDAHDFVAVVLGEGDHRTPTEARRAPPTLRVGDALTLGPLTATVLGVLDHPRLVELHLHGRPDRIWAAIAHHGRPIQYAYVAEPLALWDVWTRLAAQPAAFEPPSASFVVDWRLLDELRARNVGFVSLTHAAGLSSTGDPDLDARLPLDEPYHVPVGTAEAVRRARARGGRVVAVGTTVTRALEHAATLAEPLRAGPGLATQRIGPGSRLRVVDAIVSGAHAPGESHYELLRAFAADLGSLG